MEKYDLRIKNSVFKDLKKIPSKDAKRILTIINALPKNPRPLGCRKLSNKEQYRIRYRSYRILYSIEDNILMIYVVRVASRSRIYQKYSFFENFLHAVFFGRNHQSILIFDGSYDRVILIVIR